MTTAVVELRSGARYEPSFVDRMIMRASLTTLMWARHHSERTAASRELRMLRVLEARDSGCRRHESFSVASRQSSPAPR